MDLTNYTEEQIKEIVLKYTTSKEKIKIAQKKYRQTDKYREYRKRHYQKNIERILKQKRDNYKNDVNGVKTKKRERYYLRKQQFENQNKELKKDENENQKKETPDYHKITVNGAYIHATR